jgi:hypothetical protein
MGMLVRQSSFLCNRARAESRMRWRFSAKSASDGWPVPPPPRSPVARRGLLLLLLLLLLLPVAPAAPLLPVGFDRISSSKRAPLSVPPISAPPSLQTEYAEASCDQRFSPVPLVNIHTIQKTQKKGAWRTPAKKKGRVAASARRTHNSRAGSARTHAEADVAGSCLRRDERGDVGQAAQPRRARVSVHDHRRTKARISRCVSRRAFFLPVGPLEKADAGIILRCLQLAATSSLPREPSLSGIRAE